LAQARAARPEVALALFGDFQNLDLPRMLSAAAVPVRCINAAPPNAPPTAVEANRRHGDFDAVTVEGAGHFLQLEKPEASNARLHEVLAGLGR
jgi:pimeloyl-ACP methyl ester carboxylesterase